MEVLGEKSVSLPLQPQHVHTDCPGTEVNRKF
jgi:hypothetical protein